MFLLYYQELYLKIKYDLIKQPTKIGFAENQLFLSLIGLSPLTKSHLNILQHVKVRSSKNSLPT